MAIRIDYSNMIGDAVGGISESDWTAASDSFPKARAGFAALQKNGSVGFADVVSEDRLRDQSTNYASLAEGKYDDVVILGIGGSALGPIALRTALRPTAWNMLPQTSRGRLPRLQVLDNVDPETISALLDRLVLGRTLFIVTSKSGGTAETMSQFLIVHERVTKASLKPENHFVFVTDPAQGALRPLAQKLGIVALDIPPSVGGRFSVLTPVGTLPAALIGIDVGYDRAVALQRLDQPGAPGVEIGQRVALQGELVL
jgi:glucose-6-phosphate isomerase